MPKRKIVEAEVIVASEPTKKLSAPKPKAAAATHKRATKLPADKIAAAPVRAISREQIEKLAYSYWQARNFSGGSPEEDWLHAERTLLKLA